MMRRTSHFNYFLVVFTTNFLFLQVSAVEHAISWNSSNVQFRARRPTVEVRLGDVVRFICPDNQDGSAPSNEYLKVYEVGELAFDDCLVETTSHEIIRCGPETSGERMLRTRNSGSSSEIKPRNVAQLIRQLNPIPNGQEFKAGQTYYYITTSTGKIDGIDKENRGLCESRNMRLAVKVLAPIPSNPIRPSPPVTSSRRQDDFVTRSSENQRKFDDSEDEDSENDAHLLPRDLKDNANPKFRRPSHFNDAGVQDQQFLKVAKMAQEGKTGTFENSKEFDSGIVNNGNAWDPINVQFVSDIMQNAYQNADDSLSYQRDPDFVIHEENSVRSLEYSSSFSSKSLMTSFTILLISTLFYVLH